MPEIEPDRPASTCRLGEIGRQRSELLASSLSSFNPEAVWSSTEPKAIETAEIVAGAFGVPVQIADGLEEHHRDGTPFYPRRDDFEAAVERFFCKPDQLVLGTETAGQARDRMTGAIDDIIDAGQTDSMCHTRFSPQRHALPRDFRSLVIQTLSNLVHHGQRVHGD